MKKQAADHSYQSAKNPKTAKALPPPPKQKTISRLSDEMRKKDPPVPPNDDSFQLNEGSIIEERKTPHSREQQQQQPADQEYFQTFFNKGEQQDNENSQIQPNQPEPTERSAIDHVTETQDILHSDRSKRQNSMQFRNIDHSSVGELYNNESSIIKDPYQNIPATAPRKSVMNDNQFSLRLDQYDRSLDGMALLGGERSPVMSHSYVNEPPAFINVHENPTIKALVNKEYTKFDFTKSSMHDLFKELEDPEKEAMLFETPTENYLSLDHLNRKLFLSRPQSGQSRGSAATREQNPNMSHSHSTEMAVSDQETVLLKTHNAIDIHFKQNHITSKWHIHICFNYLTYEVLQMNVFLISMRWTQTT